jgi:hypothetical protein
MDKLNKLADYFGVSVDYLYLHSSMERLKVEEIEQWIDPREGLGFTVGGDNILRVRDKLRAEANLIDHGIFTECTEYTE